MVNACGKRGQVIDLELVKSVFFRRIHRMAGIKKKEKFGSILQNGLISIKL
jgi:hypothetical protein